MFGRLYWLLGLVVMLCGLFVFCVGCVCFVCFVIVGSVVVLLWTAGWVFVWYNSVVVVGFLLLLVWGGL